MLVGTLRLKHPISSGTGANRLHSVIYYIAQYIIIFENVLSIKERFQQ